MKPLYRSKTFWTNAVALVAAVGAAFGLELDADVQAELVVAAMAIVNIGLRLATREPVRVRKS